MKINYKLTIANATVLVCLLPYISPFKTGLDSQPYGLIFIIISWLTLYKHQTKHKHFMLLSLITFLLSSIILTVEAIIYGDTLSFIRGVYGYFVLFVAPFYFLTYLRFYDFPKRTFYLSSSLYFIAAIIQAFVDVNFFDFLVDIRTSESRGVTSLTPEPTYYGIVCLLLLMVCLVSESFKNKERKYLSLFFVIQIVFLAKSSMAILLLLILSFYFLCLKKISSIKILLGLFLLLCGHFGILHLMEGSRVYDLYTRSIELGFYLFKIDASMNERLSHIYFSLYGMLSNAFLPNFNSNFSTLLDNRYILSDGFFWYGESGKKIMSYWGGVFFNLGFIGVFYYIILASSVKKGQLGVFLFVLTPILFTAVPMAMTIVSFLFSIFIFRSELRKPC